MTTGDFYNARSAILGGLLGQLATIQEGDFVRSHRAGVVLLGVNAMQVVLPGYGWLAGDGGWIALTGNRGNAWRPPLGALPPSAALFDFSALAVRGPRCWVAGSPGSRVFFTPDAGRTWSAFATNSTVPLRAITFVDDLHGWAVGQLGVILSTVDGGQTWRRQRAGGARAAVMAVAGAAQDLPLELLARLCKEQGYLGVAEVLGRTDVENGTRGDVPAADGLHQALLHVGACAGETAWGFPIRQPGLLLPAEAILDGWNRMHNGHGADALAAYVVRQIRTWRPSVILIPAGRGAAGLSQVVQQTVTAAAKLAGDPAYMADQFKAAGCEPWNVQRVCLVSDTKVGGKLALESDDWSPRLGQTWADIALPARALLDDHDQGGPTVASVQLIVGEAAAEATATPAATRLRIGDSTNRFDIMAGIAAGNGLSRRSMAESDSRFGGPLDGLAQGRQVQAIFEHIDRDPQALLARLVKGDVLPQGIDMAAAAALTFRIAQRFRNAGHGDLADKTLVLLAERYPNDPLARTALVWRFQNLAASETPVALPPSGTGDGQVVAGPQKSPAEQAVELARQIEINRPELFALPSVRYSLAAVYRRWGRSRRRSGSMPWIAAASTATHGGTAPAAKLGLWIARDLRPSRWQTASPPTSGRIWTDGWTRPFGRSAPRSCLPVRWVTTARGRRRRCWPTTSNTYILPFNAARPRLLATRPPAGRGRAIRTFRSTTVSISFSTWIAAMRPITISRSIIAVGPLTPSMAIGVGTPSGSSPRKRPTVFGRPKRPFLWPNSKPRSCLARRSGPSEFSGRCPALAFNPGPRQPGRR